jgi:hypothetical protein
MYVKKGPTRRFETMPETGFYQLIWTGEEIHREKRKKCR